MSTLKTQPTKASVSQFINTIEDPVKRKDSKALVKMMREITGAKPVMWGSSIIGFGSFHYKYASGREGDWFVTGFSPRKQSLTIYIMSGFQNKSDLDQLGKHTTSKGCLYIKRLSDVDIGILRDFISKSITKIS